MSWNLVNILMLFGATQGFLLSIIVIIIGKKKSLKASWYLSVLLFALSMNLLFYFSSDVGIFKIQPILEVFYFPWPMLVAICFFLYIVFSAPFQKKTTVFNYLGFLPFILFSAIHLVIRTCRFVYSQNCEVSDGFYHSFNLFEEYFGIGYAIFLGYLSYKKINQIEEQIQNLYSNYNESKLKFHKKFLKLAFVFILSWIILLTIATLSNTNSLSIYYFLWLFIVVLLHWVSWNGFIKAEALLPSFDIANLSIQNDYLVLNRLEQKGGNINSDNPHYIDLVHLFEKEMIFKNEDISLENLSEKLGISKSYLSVIINTVAQSNFYHFVNTYRVDYLISLFKSGEHKQYTILSLAFKAGFNSKSTFQSSFKKITGKTPTGYIKSLENN